MLSLESILGIFNAFLLAIGFIFTIWQIRILIKTHADNHEWNRRIATQEAISNFNQGTFIHDLNELNEMLSLFERKHPIPLAEIKEKFKDNPKVQTQCHTLLNFYEGLARGVKFGVYDEEIVENSRRGIMERTSNVLEEYIKYRRNEFSPHVWGEYLDLLKRWNGKELKIGKQPIGKV